MIDREILLMWVMAIVMVLAVYGIAGWFAAYQCESAWARSGLKSDWGPVQGCLVQRKDGTWVPDKMIRDITQ